MNHLKSVTVWVIGLEGPVWFEPTEARYKEQTAIDRCVELNRTLKKRRGRGNKEMTSSWVYKPIQLKGVE